jgi:hypothetical protein
VDREREDLPEIINFVDSPEGLPGVLLVEILKNSPKEINSAFETELINGEKRIVVVDSSNISSAEGSMGDFKFLSQPDVRNKIEKLIVVFNSKNFFMDSFVHVLAPIVGHVFLKQQIITVASRQQAYNLIKGKEE